MRVLGVEAIWLDSSTKADTTHASRFYSVPSMVGMAMINMSRRMQRQRLERRRDALFVRAHAALGVYLNALHALLTVEHGGGPGSLMRRHEAAMRMRAARAAWLVEQRALAHL